MASTETVVKEMKWRNVVTPAGGALWCKVTEPDYKFDKQGRYETSLVLNPNEEATATFIDMIEDYLDKSAKTILETFPERKAKEIKIVKPFHTDYDKDDKETGNVVLKAKSTASFNDEPITISIYDAKGSKLENFKKKIGNGSTIKLYIGFKPYYLNGNIGLSVRLKTLQVIDLKEYVSDDSIFKNETGVEDTFSNNTTVDDEFDF